MYKPSDRYPTVRAPIAYRTKLYLIYQEYAKSALAAQPDRLVPKKVGFVSVVDEAFAAWLNTVVATTTVGKVLQIEIERLV
jgi:hypothetical protein